MSKLTIEVAYATPKEQCIITVEVAKECTIEGAIKQSGVLALFPEIDLTQQKVGIFGEVCPLSTLVKEGDRIEIYRPLTIDPKEARRAKAKRAKPS